MSLRIAHNADSMRMHRSLGVSSANLAKAMERLSSGLRINTAADDAAGLGISERMRAQIRGLEQADRNIMDGISMLEVIDGALNEVHSILQRSRELAVQWNGGTLDINDKLTILNEWAQLSNEIGRIEQATSFNGVPLLQSFTALMTLQIGANDGEVLGVQMVELMGPWIQLVRPNTFYALPWVDADIQGFDLHIDQVSIARGRVGALVNRLEHALNSNASARENLMDAESRIRDMDVASELTSLVKHQVLQAATSTLQMFSDRSGQRIVDLLYT